MELGGLGDESKACDLWRFAHGGGRLFRGAQLKPQCVCVGFKTGHVQLPAKALDTIKGAGLGRDICLGLRASVRDINVAHGRASLRLIASAQVRFRGPPGHKLDPN